MVYIKYTPQSGESKSSGPSDREEHRTETTEITNNQRILDKLNAIEKQLKNCCEKNKQAPKDASAGADCQKDILEKLRTIESQLKVCCEKNKQAPKDALAGADCQQAIRTIKEQCKSLNDNLSDLTDAISDNLSDLKDAINDLSKKIGEEDLTVAAELDAEEALKTTNEKLDTLKDAIDRLPSHVRVSSSSNHLEVSAEHKTYFAWTVIFAIALLLSAIFITGGFLVEFAARGYLIATVVVFVVSLVSTCVFNLAFAIGDTELDEADGARKTYFIVCGILDVGTLVMSVIGMFI